MLRKDEIKALSKKIEDYKKKAVTEAATKNGLIEPLFKELGWDFADIDIVEPEFPVFLEGENKPADYALKFEGKVCLFLEAKRLNEKIDVAIKDGVKKALQENVPWLIATNGDAIALLMIDQSVSEEERWVFQAALSDSIQGEQMLNQIIKYLEYLTPEKIQSGALESFAKQKLKETRISNVLKAMLYSDEFTELVQGNFRERYPDDTLDRDVLDKIMARVKIGEEDGPLTLPSPSPDPNKEPYITRRKRLFVYPGKGEKESVNRNIEEKRELWLAFIERKRMSTPEFKELYSFAKKGVAGFAYFLTYYGLATNDGKDKVRGGISLKINEAIVPEIKAILGVK